MGDTTQGDRIKLIREAREEALEPFAAAMNTLLPKQEHARSTTVWRWEKGEGGPSVLQGLAIVALDPKRRGLVWFADDPELTDLAGISTVRSDRGRDTKVSSKGRKDDRKQA